MIYRGTFMIKNKILKNTIILLISSFLIRGFSLLNRIIITRYLGNEGISLYSLVLPTIMLFLSISSLSLNVSIHKTKKTIKIGLNIAIISSSLCIIVLLLISKPLADSLLKQPNTFYLIILSIPLIYLTSISSVLRGYLTGLEYIGTTATANLLEQIIRITFTIIIFEISLNQTNLFYVGIAVISMSIGEIASIIITSFKIRNIKFNSSINNKEINKSILEISIPTTLSSLISNVTFFLEPIIFTFVLSKLRFSSEEILYKYSETTAYAIPMITIFSFFAMSISTVIMPKIVNSNKQQITKSIENIIYITLIPIVLVSILLQKYSKEFTVLLYNTDIGSDLVKKYIWFFVPFYFITPFNTILLSTNNSKKSFHISLISHILKLISLLILPFFNDHALILSYLICNTLTFIMQFAFLYKNYKFKISLSRIISIILYIIICYCFIKLINKFNFNFIINVIIIIFSYMLVVFLSNKEIINKSSFSSDA